MIPQKYFDFFTVALLIILMVVNVFIHFKKNKFTACIYLLAGMVFPVATNIIYVMCGGYIYSMMMYGEVMIFVLLLYLGGTTSFKWKDIANGFAVIAITIIVVLFCRYANVCYLNADYVQKAGISYFNRIITRIENIEGYKNIKNSIFIAGGPMMGKSLPTDELIVTKDLNCVLVIDDLNETNYPCINCGKCTFVCPVNIYPVLIMKNCMRSM